MEASPQKPSQHSNRRKQGAITPREFIPAEVSLEMIGFFTPSSKAIKGRYRKEKIISANGDDGNAALTVEIQVSPDIGLPITIDFDYYRAFQKICVEHLQAGAGLGEPIQVPTNKLLRYAGKQKGKPQYRDVQKWFDRMAGTLVKGRIYHAGDKRYKMVRGSVFETVVTTGNELPNGELAETNYVWLATWYAENIAGGYLRTIDLTFHNRLSKPIAKATYPLLETGWHAANGSIYRKRYRALCDEFLLTPRKHLSRIKEQLDPSLEELKNERFIKRWSYHRSRSGDDWIINFWPGEKYLEDKAEREQRRKLAQEIGNRRGIGEETLESSDAEVELLPEILAVCGDQENEAAYRKAIKRYDRSLIWMTLSETKQAAAEGKIKKNRGAYFMDTIKRLAEMRKQAAN